jgi:hypothetical protein
MLVFKVFGKPRTVLFFLLPLHLLQIPLRSLIGVADYQLAPVRSPPLAKSSFVNRDCEVRSVFELLLCNVARATEDKHTHPYNVAVAAQNLGTGKTTFALQFRDAVSQRPPSFQEARYFAHWRRYFDAALKFKTLYVDLNDGALRPRGDSPTQPHTLKCWLLWAIMSAAAAQVPELLDHYADPNQSLTEALGGVGPLFVVLDEIDVITAFQPSSPSTSVYHDLLELLLAGLSDLPHLVFCAGASTNLLQVGRGLRTPRTAPTGLNVVRVQFPALQKEHIAQILERELPSLIEEHRVPLADRLLLQTSGVARLVQDAVAFLKQQPGNLELRMYS